MHAYLFHAGSSSIIPNTSASIGHFYKGASCTDCPEETKTIRPPPAPIVSAARNIPFNKN